MRGDYNFEDSVMRNVSTVAAVAVAAAALSWWLPATAADVGVSVQISQPGVYGRVDIGRFPQPVLVQSQPVIIVREVRVQPAQPVYLWVPPGHQKNWRKHCGRYGACGVPVYFVQDDWYRDNVKGHGKGQGKGHGKDKDKDKDKYRN